MRIALVKPPPTYADWNRYPVLGLSYLGSCIEHSGFDCEIFDAHFNGWSENELLARITNYQPDVVGITAMTHEIIPAASIAKSIKKEFGIPIIIGGCHVTALPERTLIEFPVFDFGVYGEGEKTIVELLHYLHKRSPAPDLESINGLVFRNEEGSVCVNEPRPFLTPKELDALPYPAFHHYYEKNRHFLSGKHGSYVMITSRGCPYNCAFCMRVLGTKVRRRSAENVCQEIEYALSTYNIHTISFIDDVFLFDSEDTRQLLHLMIESGISKRIRWGAQIRADSATPELIALAKKAGCSHLDMGVESGDNEILKKIGKGVTVARVKHAVRIIKKAGISLNTYFILGHPGETKSSLLRTVKLATELNTNEIAVGCMVPYPGTRIFNMAQHDEGGYRLLNYDWSQYDKYFARALEIKGLPYKVLARWQKYAVIGLYLRNFRFFDAIRFFWRRKRALAFLIEKWMEHFHSIKSGLLIMYIILLIKRFI